MYIISKFHDYYDAAASNGIDKTCIYKRQLKEQATTPAFDKLLSGFSRYKSIHCFYGRETIKLFIIGFCGKLYAGAQICLVNSNDGMDKDPVYCLSFEEVESIIKAIPRRGYLQSRKTFFSDYQYSRPKIEKFFKYFDRKEAHDIFIEIKSPIFVYDDNIGIPECKFVINGRLKDYEFYRIFDTYLAFQEIYSYISGVLGTGEKETIQISDKDKLKAKGFDEKWSFRNPNPPKRKQKK